MQTRNRKVSTDTCETGETVIRFDGVSKTFKSRQREVVALDAVDLQVRRNAATGLVGPDAAGKTTIMRLIAALLTPDQGRIQVLGMDTQKQGLAIQSCLSYMPQHFGLYEDLTVIENLHLYADLHGLSESRSAERSRKLLHVTNLAAFTSRRAAHLSGGMKQKLGLACTLVGEPQLLLLDEPTAGVDPLSRRELWQIIDQLVRDEGLTVLVSTAYLDEAQRCAEVTILHEGHVLGTGPPRSFLEPLSGKVFVIQVPERWRRTVQREVAKEANISAASLEAKGVRILTRTGAKPSLDNLLPNNDRFEIEPVSPRFEDSFITIIQAQQQDVPRQEHRTSLSANVSGHGAANHEGVIRVDNVSRQFGSFYAVRNITFSVKQGEIFGLLGANGAGKSTTFRMLCGLLPVTSGRLLVAGVDLRQAAATARGQIGYMAQKFSLYGKLSVRENLKFFSSAYGLSGRRQGQRIVEALEQFGLESLADVAGDELPLGYQQRLSMACALMHEPEIVFLDEPTSGVAPLARRTFWDRILRLADAGITIMVTTHFMNEAEYCDRVAIMNAGEILLIDTPEGIRQHVQTRDNPDPTMEDAFVHLIEQTRGNHE
jgi:ABC-2 type transport system ATP-binding protein